MHPARVRIDLLLEVVDQAYNRRAWHGTNLRGSIRGLSPAEADRRPAAGRHNIREVVLHVAYWKYAVWRKLTGAKRGLFPLAGSNWFRRPVPGGPPEWKEAVDLLDRMHGQLRDAVAAISDADLAGKPAGTRYTRATLIYGAASHDLYHAGQIQLLKRLEASGV